MGLVGRFGFQAVIIASIVLFFQNSFSKKIDKQSALGLVMGQCLNQLPKSMYCTATGVDPSTQKRFQDHVHVGNKLKFWKPITVDGAEDSALIGIRYTFEPAGNAGIVNGFGIPFGFKTFPNISMECP